MGDKARSDGREDDVRLSEAKVGDEVIMTHGGFGNRNDTVETIERVLSVHVVVGKTRFRRDSGTQAGKYERWASKSYIRIPIEGEVDEVRSKNRASFLANKLSNMSWKHFPLQVLQQVSAILESSVATKQP